MKYLTISSVPANVVKLVAYVRGLTLAVGCWLKIGKRYESQLIADMQTMVNGGSPYSALTMSRISGVPCKEATDELNRRRNENRERADRIEARRKAEADLVMEG
jgi:hypothetical protein